MTGANDRGNPGPMSVAEAWRGVAVVIGEIEAGDEPGTELAVGFHPHVNYGDRYAFACDPCRPCSWSIDQVEGGKVILAAVLP